MRLRRLVRESLLCWQPALMRKSRGAPLLHWRLVKPTPCAAQASATMLPTLSPSKAACTSVLYDTSRSVKAAAILAF